MSNWGPQTLTTQGQQYFAEFFAGEHKLNIDKIALGAGVPADIENATTLADEKATLTINSKTVDGSKCTFACSLINTAVDDVFVAKELGLFSGSRLLAVSLDSLPDTIPNKNLASPVVFDFTIVVEYDDATNVTVSVDDTGMANVGHLEDHMADSSAHANMTFTIDDTNVPTKDDALIKDLLDNAANRIKMIAGTDDWKTAADSNINTLASFITGLNVNDNNLMTSNTGNSQEVLDSLAHQIKAITGNDDWKQDPLTTIKALEGYMSVFATRDDIIRTDMGNDTHRFVAVKTGAWGIIRKNQALADVNRAGWDYALCLGKNFHNIMFERIAFLPFGPGNSAAFTLPVAFGPWDITTDIDGVAVSMDPVSWVKYYATSVREAGNTMIPVNAGVYMYPSNDSLTGQTIIYTDSLRHIGTTVYAIGFQGV